MEAQNNKTAFSDFFPWMVFNYRCGYCKLIMMFVIEEAHWPFFEDFGVEAGPALV